jgi:uncharacterized membrane protein YfcA
MSLQLAIVMTGAFLGAVITGGAGFAFAIIATVIWIHVLTPLQNVMLAAACASTLHVASVWHFRREISFQRLWPFLAGAILGAPVGIYALQFIPADQFRFAIGILIIVYSIFMAIRPRFHQIKFSTATGKVADGTVGWVSGILGGAVMMHGILPTIWCVVRGWKKDESRCVYQPYILFTSLYVMLLAGINIRAEAGKIGLLYLACLPALAVGFLIGLRIFNWINEKLFLRIVLIFVFISGVLMLFGSSL